MFGKPEENRPLGVSRRGGEDDIKLGVKTKLLRSRRLLSLVIT
jgi:hypothetical protein